ncbi:hypothetical protein HPB47_000446 [Ixodes persulcatus]|uniref:Uncharacterized protein n=1 Tax=Ixodes persulcatus TaxID=34615 RepID=A0AC60PRR8_IXOPE|nr:hypothetical protein HPB47_000446 [Ixodes persulcatus]
MADPLVQKRKLGEDELSGPDKRHCEGSIDDRDFEKASSVPLNGVVEREVLRVPRIKESVAAWWDTPYEQQLRQKQDLVKKVLVKYARKLEATNPALKPWLKQQREAHGGCCPVLPIRASPVTEGYRNKNEFSVGRHLATGEATVGFRLSSYRQGSMSVAPPDALPNVPASAKAVTRCFQEYVRQSGKEPFDPESHGGYWRQLTVRTSCQGHVMAIVVIHPQGLTEHLGCCVVDPNGTSFQEEITEEKRKLREFFESGPGQVCGVTSLYLQRFDKKRPEGEQAEFEHLFGTTELEERVRGLSFRVGPDAFFQVNTPAAEVLLEVAEDLAALGPRTTLLDVCCGTGTIGLCMAAKVARVYGVEVCKRAVENAKRNAEANGIGNASFVLGRAEDTMHDVMHTLRDSEDMVAVVDPPRQGLHNKVLRALRATASIKRLVYISCNPEGALQNFLDLARPASNNYRGQPFVVVKAAPVDMFPHTPHCELVLLLERLESQ